MFTPLMRYDLQIIVVDDGSTDRTVDVVKRYMMKSNSHIKLLKLGANKGKGGAVKRGVRCALGRYVLMVRIMLL